jgi:hypothetical protein
MREDIKKWLEGNTPDYNVGVLLFSKHSRNRSLQHFFTRKGDSGSTMLKLRYELGKIANGAPVAHKPKAVPHSPLTAGRKAPLPTAPADCRLTIDPDGKINPNDLPEHLRTLYDKNVEDYKLLRGAHAAMAVAKTKNERKKLRKQIAKLDDAITAHWAIIDEWVASGKLPAESDKQPTGALTPQDVNAYRTYISRGVADPDKLTAGKREIIQERIAALIAGGQKFDNETIAKLTALGFKIE